MSGRHLLARVALALAALALGIFPASAEPASRELRLTQNFPYRGGTDLDFHGRFIYAGVEGAEGGVKIFKLVTKDDGYDCPSGRKSCAGPSVHPGFRIKQVGFVPCPGNQNDPLVVKPGLLALGAHQSDCTKHKAGVALFDVRNPKRPRLLDDIGLPGGTHTVSLYPGKPIIYASPGGLLNGGGVEQILDVSNPRKIKLASTYKPHEVGCHDITWYFKNNEKLAFCPGLSGTELWNVKNPREPELISHIGNPIQDFHHYALPTRDGSHLVVSDENFEAHDCTSGQSPTGAFFVYDISNRQVPLPVGKFSPQRGAEPVGSLVTDVCTSHQFNFIPGTDTVVSAWYTGGTNVIDFSNPSAPVELTHYQPENANTWSSYFYKDFVFASDLIRGLDVLRPLNISR